MKHGMTKRARRIAALIAAAVLLMATAPAAFSAQTVRTGDVNADGEINAADAARVLLTAVGKVTLTPDGTAAADVNADGQITASDAVLILLHAVGKKEIAPSPAVENAVAFSHPAGYYDEDVSLELTAPAGYTVYYTLDGTDPRTSDTRLTYDGAISLGSSWVTGMGTLTKLVADYMGTGYANGQLVGTAVRAWATDGTRETAITTNTYFIYPNLAAAYHLPYICITLPPEDFAPQTGIYYTVMDNPYGQKEHKTAYCEIFDAEGRRQADQYIELSMNGNGSLVYYQKAMRLYFKKDLAPDGSKNPGKLKYDLFGGTAVNAVGDVIDEYDCIVLRNGGNDTDGAHMRDALFQRMGSVLTPDVQASQPVMVFIDGEFWGVYWAMERYDEHYFNAHYGVDEENVVVLETPSPHVTDNNSSPYEVASGVEGDQKPWEDLLNFVKTHDMRQNEYYEQAIAQIDTASLIDVIAVNCYAVNWDWPGNNVKVWRNKNADDPSGMDTKWRFCLVDLDMTAGLYNNGASTNMMKNITSPNTVLTSLFSALMKNESFKEEYVARFTEICNDIFTPAYGTNVLNGITLEVQDAMALHYNRWFNQSYSGWANSVNSLNRFFSRRGNTALGHLYDYYRIPR